MALLFQLQVVLQSYCTLLVLLSYPFIKTLPLSQNKYLRPLSFLLLLPLDCVFLSLAAVVIVMAFAALFIINFGSVYLLSPLKKTTKLMHTVFSVEITQWQ